MAPKIIRSISVAISIPLIDADNITDKKTFQYSNAIKQVKIQVIIEAKNADFLKTIINKKIRIIGRNARNVSIFTQLSTAHSFHYGQIRKRLYI